MPLNHCDIDISFRSSCQRQQQSCWLTDRYVVPAHGHSRINSNLLLSDIIQLVGELSTNFESTNVDTSSTISQQFNLDSTDLQHFYLLLEKTFCIPIASDMHKQLTTLVDCSTYIQNQLTHKLIPATSNQQPATSNQ